MPSPSPLIPGSETVPHLEVIDVGDHRTVQISGHPVGCYRRDDVGSERLLATQLAETLTLDAVEIAAAFGMHSVTLSRLRGQFRASGSHALMPRKRGPKRPTKLTPRLLDRFRELREEGLSFRAIARRVSRPGREISYGSVALALKSRAAEPVPRELPFEESGLDAPRPSSEGTKSELLPGESRRSRYAGALLLFAGLARLDVWGIFRALGVSAGPWRRWGWAETVAAVVLCFALRFRSIEDSKNALREDLGVLLGHSRSPGLLTLRAKIAALAESVDPLRLSQELFRRYLALEPVWEGLYYVDGHFCPYYGQQPTPKGWDPKRRLAATGHTDAYVHDARGRALFFLSRPLNDSLARAIPALIGEIRRAHGQGPFSLVFDRGGYSGEAFRCLRDQGIGFITYLKGRKARRRYPESRVRPGWFRFEDQRHSYRLYEKRTRVTGVGAIRTILFLGEEGQQIPVLTNLDAACKPARVVHCLRLRWRQENSFKFLTENYAIDQIIQYGAEKEQAERLVPNPRRRALKERIHSLDQQIQALEAQLGRALDENQESQRPTARGFKIAHGTLRRKIAQLRQILARLESRLLRTPGQIDAAKAEKTRSLLREDRRLVVNSLKLVAYNAERMLALRFDKHYGRTQDAFSVFRALLHLPGEVRCLGTDQLEVVLDRPDSAKVATALEALLGEINAEPPRLLGDGPPLSFALRA
jgi:transposase